MKRIFIVIFLVFVSLGGLYFANSINFKKDETKVLGEELQRGSSAVEVSFGDEKYAVYWLVLSNLDTLELIPNFDDSQTASSAFDKYGCELLINGGFYTEAGKPIGLFRANSETIQEFSVNVLMNGVFSVNDFSTPRITREVPGDPLKIALQTGPILIENSFNQKLNLASDKSARRVISAVTGDNKLIFMVIYDPKSVFLGPELVDLPQIVSLLSAENDLNIADAINLDGGSASAFKSRDFSLNEISPVGSFFCLQ